MEKILQYCLLVLSILLLANNVSSGVTTIVEDITVQKEEGSLLCDTLECPKETDKCRVTKMFDRIDENYFIRVRKCIDANGVVIKKERFRELIGGFSQSISVTMEAGNQGAVIFSNPNSQEE